MMARLAVSKTPNSEAPPQSRVLERSCSIVTLCASRSAAAAQSMVMACAWRVRFAAPCERGAAIRVRNRRWCRAWSTSTPSRPQLCVEKVEYACQTMRVNAEAKAQCKQVSESALANFTFCLATRLDKQRLGPSLNREPGYP
jgi:hypothetical protein